MMKRHKVQLFFAGISVGTLALATANAQSPAAGSEASGLQLEEIVVTALRRSEPLLKAPVAITAIQGDELQSKGINTVVDLQNTVPGLMMSTSGNGVIVGIRGVQTTDISSKGEDDVSFNVDGGYVGRGLARATAFFDLERVEILRGPQGTLYGRSATAGAINLITNKPKLDELGGYAKLEYGNYNTKRAEAAVNVPLGSAWAVRFSGATNQRDGYTKSVSYDPVVSGVTYHLDASNVQPKNDQSDATLRASILYQPSDAFTGRLTATVGNQGGAGASNQVDSFLTGSSGKSQLNVFANPVPSWVDNHFANIDGSFNVRLGGSQLDVSGSRQHFTVDQQRTNPNIVYQNGGVLGISRSVNDFKTTQFEVRLSNVDTGLFDYVVGANHYFEDIAENGRNWNAPLATPSDTRTYAHQFEVKNQTSHKAYGVFGQGTWHASDKLGVVAGLRYTHDATERVGWIAPPVPFFTCIYPNPCNTGFLNNGNAEDSKVTWKVGVNYQMDADNLLYASVATGFKGGGFNDYDPVSNNSSGTAAYEPSELTAYEVGYKGRIIPRLTLTSSAFYYDYAKDQITSLVNFPIANTTIIYTVAVPAKVYGLENELSYQLSNQTVMSGSIAYQKSEFVNFLTGGTFGNQVQWKGQSLDQNPRLVATVALDHAFQLAKGSIKLHGGYKYSDGYLLSDYANAVRYRQPSFTRSDASITYAADDDRYSVQLFVQNIENKVQRTSSLGGYTCPYGGVGGQCQVGGVPAFPRPGNGEVANQPYGYLNFTTTTPRFLGVRVNVKF